MRTIRAVPLMLVALAACEARKVERAPAADSTAAVPAPDTATARPDSVRADSVRTDPAAGTTPAKASAKTTDPYIGRDSAFGPKFAVDSTGKLVPIGTKKP